MADSRIPMTKEKAKEIYDTAAPFIKEMTEKMAETEAKEFYKEDDRDPISEFIEKHSGPEPEFTGPEEDNRISPHGRQVTDPEPKPEDRFKSVVNPVGHLTEEVLNKVAVHGFEAVAESAIPPTLTGVVEELPVANVDQIEVDFLQEIADIIPEGKRDELEARLKVHKQRLLDSFPSKAFSGERPLTGEWTPPAIGEDPSSVVKNLMQTLIERGDPTVPVTLHIRLDFVFHQGKQGTHENEITCRPEDKMRLPRVEYEIVPPSPPPNDHWFDGLTGVPIVPVKRETSNGSDDTADGERGAVEGSGAGEAV